ncbi:IS110 family transposase [Dehalogenimonas etheniformans]|uniref:IS110 family transposase n=1 Tax=Dehalogenimonas etheniformans TaxID=1536648 RepID=UPI00167F233D|nr:IS110 family transposase [Dehalogenimonas etheniformans]QNT75728.1 IS110 family transposase [Dehalogenimonas etheniformans]QNT75891.1 IS110 family transposase [Dehalogenimonas etheniformans]QNT76992.1 IS110 family transposase [Dehalogenimonas etheniformans]
MQNTAARKVRQVPEGYLVIGIDPHKSKHAAVAITQDFTIRDKFKFENAMEGFELLLRRVRTEMVRADCRGVMFAIETGGHYWRNIAYYLDAKGIPFRFINQYTLKRRREGKDLNHRKNDYRDSEVAAQLLCTGEFVESGLPQGVYADLRSSHNAYRRLVKERTRITNLIKGLLDGVFPEFVHVFKDPCAVTAQGVLSCCLTPWDVAGMDIENFIAKVEANYHGHRLMRRKLADLHEAAKMTIGISSGARSVVSEMGFLVEKLELIKKHIKEIDQTLTRLVDQTEEGKYLLSITGLSYIAVAGLIAELGCFKAYRTAKQMIKMAGSNPTESESAGKKSAHTPMSKQGRPVLRYCAWTSVIPMLRFNADFREWAKKRRERPIHENPLCGREIVGAALNKLLRLAFSMVKNQTFYGSPQLVSVAS